MEDDARMEGTKAERLAQLAELHRQGVLSDQEFEASSARIVGGSLNDEAGGVDRPPSKRLGRIGAGSIAGIALLVIGVLLLAHSHPKSAGDNTTDPKLASVQRAVDSFNASNTIHTTQFLQLMSQGVPVKCAVGFDVQSPDLVIFTETPPLGLGGWRSVALDGSGAVVGADSEATASYAGVPHYDPTDYVGCQISPDGKLALLSADGAVAPGAVTAPPSTAASSVYCEDEANRGEALTAGCIQENGAVYTPTG
jgi:hypothetical protein